MKNKKLSIVIAMVSAVLLIMSSAMVFAAHTNNELRGDNFISVDKAKELALYSVPGTVEEVELIREGDKQFLEVEIEYNGDEYAVKLNPYSGDVWRVEHERDIDASVVKVKVSEEYAKVVASRHVEGRITDIEATMINGKAFYEVEIQQGITEYDVLVDMVTGKLIRTESNTLEHEDDESEDGNDEE